MKEVTGTGISVYMSLIETGNWEPLGENGTVLTALRFSLG